MIYRDTQAYVTSCDVDRDPVQKIFHNRRIPWKSGVRKCTVSQGCIRLTDKRATAQLVRRRSVLESGEDGYNGKYPSGMKSLCDGYNGKYPSDIISFCDGYKNMYPSSIIATILARTMTSVVIAKILRACVSATSRKILRPCVISRAVSDLDDREEVTWTRSRAVSDKADREDMTMTCPFEYR